MLLAELETTVRKYMLLSDPHIIKLLMAFVSALTFDIPPPWLFIIANSSGGKSMLLNAMADVKGYRALDDITANAFLSGKQRHDKPASFLQQLNKSGDFLVFKDFTTILSKDKESKKAVIGTLRKIYDGEMSRRTGQGDPLEWEGKLGVLGGSTTSFHTKMREFADLGERFILYNLKQPPKRDVGKLVFQNGIQDNEAKVAMRAAFAEYAGGLKELDAQPVLDQQVQEDILDLADLTTTARSAVEREEYGQRHDMITPHLEEGIGRFQKQLMSLAYGFIAINRNDEITQGLTDEDRQCLYSIALDSIPMIRRKVLVKLAEYDGSNVTVKTLCNSLGLPDNTVKMALEDLNAYHMVSKSTGMGESLSWHLGNQWLATIRKFENIKVKLTESVAPVAVEQAPIPEQSWEQLGAPL